MDEKNIFALNKYRKSIIFDQIVSLSPEIMFIVFYGQIKRFFSDDIFILLFFLGGFSMVYYLFSDFVLKKRIIGKSVFGIQRCDFYPEKKAKIFLLVYRRILEVSIHPYIIKSFLEKSIFIDRLTGTYIEEYSKKRM